MGWENAKELTKQAKEWTNYMVTKHDKNILASVNNSVIYTPNYNENDTKIRVVQDTSVDAIFKIKTEGKRAVLNFASYKHPGGGYIKGAMAQEESLCHASDLYNVLKNDKFKNDFYDYNKEHLNKGLYDSRLIYSPDIIFYNENEESKTCDVITCAAPNSTVAKDYQHISEDVLLQVMKDRILMILRVAQENKVKVLILGAFGCGVFGNNPIITAKIFKECLTKYQYYRNVFDVVVFAIPDDKYYNIFKDILDERKL